VSAQAVKPVLYCVTKRIWDWRWLFTSGGMPSSHSAAVSALATGIAVSEGLDSAFAIALVTALVVLYDAAGVRRAASIQANVLNQILRVVQWASYCPDPSAGIDRAHAI
jgi:acid phosphatase family membrane protein YuiD